ncbi:hypothetical protein [Sphingomonas sp.]|uniref:hypothetical protein n=1 Tax=Sphingomonas sp. TaxID=28214 RepID=UPI0035BBBB84
MSALRDAAERLARSGRLPVPNPDRRLQCEKAALALAERGSGSRADKEPWDDFLRRIGILGV